MAGSQISAFYFDDPPLNANSNGRGLNQVNARILGLFPDSVPVVVNRMRLRPGQTLLVSPRTDYVSILGSAFGFAVRAAGRVSLRLTSRLQSVLIRTASLPSSQAAEYLFAPVGSDMASIERALLVAQRLGTKPLLYLVDDPLARLRREAGDRPRAKREAARLRALLEQCAAVFCISEPLISLVKSEYGVDSTLLPLPYEYDSGILCRKPKNQIIYVGSINEIYAPELDYWIELLHRMGFFRNGRLLVTGDMPDRTGITKTKFASSRALQQEIANSRACLLPVSSRASDLCYSSFPSKLLDYLAYGRLILASAPGGSVAADFFRETRLRYCFNEGQVDATRVGALIDSSEDLSASYRYALDLHFSGARFKAIVQQAVDRRS
jgi:hypothetical protein